MLALVIKSPSLKSCHVKTFESARGDLHAPPTQKTTETVWFVSDHYYAKDQVQAQYPHLAFAHDLATSSIEQSIKVT